MLLTVKAERSGAGRQPPATRSRARFPLPAPVGRVRRNRGRSLWVRSVICLLARNGEPWTVFLDWATERASMMSHQPSDSTSTLPLNSGVGPIGRSRPSRRRTDDNDGNEPVPPAPADPGDRPANQGEPLNPA